MGIEKLKIEVGAATKTIMVALMEIASKVDTVELTQPNVSEDDIRLAIINATANGAISEAELARAVAAKLLQLGFNVESCSPDKGSLTVKADDTSDCKSIASLKPHVFHEGLVEHSLSSDNTTKLYTR